MRVSSPSKGRVLVVGGRPPRHPYTHQLHEAGFEVAEASQNAEALRRIQSREFDLVIGISMPGVQGLDLVRRIRRNSPSPQVVLVLDALDNQIAVEAARLGALQSLVEPIEPRLLVLTATHAVRLNRARLNRASRGTDAISVTATHAKREFADIFEKAIRGGRVVITKHDAPKAVLVSVEDFDALVPVADVELDTLSREFDALLARMQTPAARAGMRTAFDSSAKELGEALLLLLANVDDAVANPCIYVLAGTNGAGKSSIVGAAFSAKGAEYFNPDEAARRILFANPHISYAEANSLAWHEGLRLLERAIAERCDYAFETTLGGKTITDRLEAALSLGIQVRVWYAGLLSPELHIARVRARVARGGHDIPESKIRERYNRSRRNLIRLLPVLTELRVYDNSFEADPNEGLTPEPTLVLHVRKGTIVGPDDLTQTPDWAKPVVAAALSLGK